MQGGIAGADAACAADVEWARTSKRSIQTRLARMAFAPKRDGL
jgi:hypothetical protein